MMIRFDRNNGAQVWKLQWLPFLFLLGLVVTSVLPIFAVGGLPLPYLSEDGGMEWTTFQNTASRSGYSVGWEFQEGENLPGILPRFFWDLVVIDDKVFCVTSLSNENATGHWNSNYAVFVFDAFTGEFLWGRNTTGQTILTAITGVLFICDEVGVTAIDTTTREVIWETLIEGYSWSPVVSEGLLFLKTDFNVLCLSAADGAIIWNQSAPVYWHPSISSDYVFAASSYSVIALERTTGDVVWESNLGSDTPPVIDSGIIITTDYGGIFARSEQNGALLWWHNATRQRSSPVVIVDNIVIQSVTSYLSPFLSTIKAVDQINTRERGWVLFAYDLQTGRLRWSKVLDPYQQLSYMGYASALSAGPNAVLTSIGSRSFAVDILTGSVLWQRNDFHFTTQRSIARAYDRIYVAEFMKIVCYSADYEQPRILAILVTLIGLSIFGSVIAVVAISYRRVNQIES